MFERSSLRWPILLGVILIVLIVALAIGWVLLSVVGAVQQEAHAPLYWTLLSVGSALFILVLVGIVMYLTLSIKSVRLTIRQSNFIDSVTHELKSPIASLKLYLQTLNRRAVSPEKSAEFHRCMLEDVERLDQLINHLLEAGRVEKGSLPGEPEWISLDGLLVECAESVCLRYQVPNSAVQFQLQPCDVEARRIELSMIFRNLLDNAVKYAGEPPAITLEMNVQHETVTVRVGDNGAGIPPESRRKIFARFVRLGLELERQKPGTGLGLYIVRTLVRRLGGKIQVLDREQGQGTIFEVKLRGRLADRPPAQPMTATRPSQDEEAA